MITTRHKRTAMWGMLLGAVPATLYLVQVEDRVHGPFQVRPATRAEVRAPVAGFLHVVYHDEGDRVSAGAVVVCLEVPDLTSRLAQKQAELREARAKLRLLEAGTRPEELEAQRGRVQRARAWRDQARRDLEQAREALREDLARLDAEAAACRAEFDLAQDVLNRDRKLHGIRAVSDEQYQTAQKQGRVARAREQQARAQKRARQALGTLEAETELGRREKALADARATLTLLEAGSRPEEVEAERARRARIQEELSYLQGLQEKVTVRSPVAGVVSTPRLKERVGQYVREGELLCEVEEPAALEAEIAVAEQDVARLRPGQAVELKARALPFETLRGQIERVAPRASHQPAGPAAVSPVRGELPGTVTVCCRLEGADTGLRPGMTGYSHIHCGRRPAGEILAERALRFVRTEFWSWW